MKPSNRLEATAYHEAGHAVMAWLLRLPFKEVSIVPDASQEFRGRILHEPYPKWFNPEVSSTPQVSQRTEAYIKTYFAGQIAERKLRGRAPAKSSHAGDDSGAIDFALSVAGSSEAASYFLRYLFCCARDSVFAYWPMVNAVAAALLKRKRLSEREVQRAIQRAILEAV